MMTRLPSISDAGLTLIELLVCLSLLAIILCFTLPFGSALYQKNQLQLKANAIKNAIQMAKTQALLTGESLALTPLPEALDWSEGMLLFVDDGKHRYTPGLKLVHEWHWKLTGIQVTWHGFQSKDYIRFTSELGRNTANGYFRIANATNAPIKLIVNRLGRVKESL